MDSAEIFECRKDGLFKLIKESLVTATKAHDILFESPRDKQNEIIAAVYLNKAISLMSAARSIYISNYELLQRTEIDEIFHTFDIFESEFLTNVSTNHSHQWTDITFQKFKDAVEAFVD